MRKDLSFADNALTDTEFAEKYWRPSVKYGYVPFQPHSMKITDGRDEREQLIINDLMWAMDEIRKLRFILHHNGIDTTECSREWRKMFTKGDIGEKSAKCEAANKRLLEGKSSINDSRREFGLSPINDEQADQLTVTIQTSDVRDLADAMKMVRSSRKSQEGAVCKAVPLACHCPLETLSPNIEHPQLDTQGKRMKGANDTSNEGLAKAILELMYELEHQRRVLLRIDAATTEMRREPKKEDASAKTSP